MAVTRINIIAIQERYLDIITKQVIEILGDRINIQSITVKDLQSNTITGGDIVVISNSQIKGLVSQLIPNDCPIIIAKRDINYTNTKELLSLPSGQEILIVNDNEVNTKQTVESLRETIFEHNFIAYVPGKNIPKFIDYIITPGERQLLPSGLKNIIDIGPRLLDISTFEEIIVLLKYDYSLLQIAKRYFKACVSLSSNYYNLKKSSRDIRDIAQYHFEDIISVSESMNEVVQIAKQYTTDHKAIHIHIEGKSGTGKSMLAQAIHNYSSVAKQSFVSVDCASTDFKVVENILFGSNYGQEFAYGLFELAGEGTVCIDEIGQLPLSVQERIYRVLNEGEFLRPSDSQLLTLHCRVITTNTRGCKELVEKGLFNRKLYDLLSKYSLEVPTLSERMKDFLPLIDNVKQRIKRDNIKFTNEIIAFLKEFNWKDNVKELYNVITYLAFLNGDRIGIEHLPFHLHSKANQHKFNGVVDANIKINEVVAKIEKHGFLDESIKILNVFYAGKKEYKSYGRKAIKANLEREGTRLSEQQLRMRLEILQGLDLIIVRQGRAGSTISRKGEQFLEEYNTKKPIDVKK